MTPDLFDTHAHLHFPEDPRGRWSVDVVTASGQLIGRVRFTVVP